MGSSNSLPHAYTSDHLRAVTWLGILAILVALLPPIGFLQADAASRQDCPPGYDWNEDTGECEQQDTPAPLIDLDDIQPGQATLPPEAELQITPTQTPTPQLQVTVPPPIEETIPPDAELQVTPTPTPGTVEPPAPTPTPEAEERTVRFLVLSFECPPDTDPNQPWSVLTSTCNVPPSIPVTLTHGSVGGSESSQSTTAVSGFTTWTELSPGHHYVIEDVPPGFGQPVVWCAVFDPDDDFVEPHRFAVEDGTTIGVELLAGQHIQCDWFNFIAATEGASTVTVTKHDCETIPPGFSTLEEWLAACGATVEGVEFTLHPPVGLPRHAETDATGSARWTNVPPGPFALSETPRPGFGEPVVLCENWLDDGFTIMPPTNYPATGGRIAVENDYLNSNFVCHWFNIPDDTPGDGSTVIVQKYICPERIESDADYATVLALECVERGDGIEFTLEAGGRSSTRTIAGGIAVWENVPEGPFNVAETTEPARFPDPVWYCFGHYVDEAGDAVVEPIERVSAPLGVLEDSIDHPNTTYTCYVYNFPFHDRIVTVHKWRCPVDFDPDVHGLDRCFTPMSDVAFTLTDAASSVTKTTVGGTTTWYGVEPGELTLDEEIPPGYGEPIILCSLTAAAEGGAGVPPYTETGVVVASTDGAISRSIGFTEFEWVCHYYNVPKGDAEITIRKWTCPPGYDVESVGADPTVDCTEATDGVAFTAGEGGVSSVTGETIPGAVRFGELEPGVYVIEETVPDGIETVFVWDCVGGDIPAVHPHPLHWGPLLNIAVVGGDSVTCDWYNVPQPEGGSLTVRKHTCNTETFVSAVDCEIYEHGASFELFPAFEDVSLGSGTTGATGTYTWAGLAERSYRLEEISHEPCHIASDNLDIEGNYFVTAGGDTVVDVYNCTTDPGTPPDKPGKPPTDWPNTGAGAFAQTPQMARQDASPGAGTSDAPFFPIRCLDEAGPTPAASATPTIEESCRRGAIPDHIVIDGAGIDADIEIAEVVDGVMEAPTGPLVVAWYKETGRLGEPNNIVIAGHLNWWNVPEGVFYHLEGLEEGDRIEIIGEDGATYVYEVQWVRQKSSLEPPPVDVIGPTDESSLTLITCGGDWDAANAEYTERTVVRAAQVEVISGSVVAVPEGGDGADGPGWATLRNGIVAVVTRAGGRHRRERVPRSRHRPHGARAPSRREART